MLASVAICTRNRSASLARTLHSIVPASRLVNEPWELLVVDNASTDDTAAVAKSFADRLPLRYVTARTPGLSNARNVAVRASEGDYIIWTDDDVLVDTHWLSAYFEAFSRFPDEAIFGGMALPVYEEPVQQWFKANEDGLASLLAIRNEPAWDRITHKRVPYGLNYATRRQEQTRHLYNPELGVAPGRRTGGEEVAVIRAILDDGGTGRWIWDAKVHHCIPVERQTEEYIEHFYSASGYFRAGATIGSEGAGYVKTATRSALEFVKADRKYRRLRVSNRAECVAPLIRRARAEGSILRCLGLCGSLWPLRKRHPR